VSTTRRLAFLAYALAWVVPAACAPTETASDLDDATGLSDTFDGDLASLDIRMDHGPRPHDATDAEILYPGYPCDADEACSTGLCYGSASPQGAFEQARCQLACLGLNDFGSYCDSHDDCCSGRCCLDCGPKRGLCTLTLPELPQ
jgi:hypothetical protein